jgi:hypothetical protein
MKLSDYIKELEYLLEEHGDIENIYTSSDDEGNSFNKIYYDPEVWLLSPNENANRPENLIPIKSQKQSTEEWLGENCLDEYDEVELSRLKKVVLL